MLILHLVSCSNQTKGDCKYDDYDLQYTTENFLVLVKKGYQKDSLSPQRDKTSLFFRSIDSSAGKIITDTSEAIGMIDKYQGSMSNPKGTRYIDFYYLNLEKYLEEIKKTNTSEMEKLGVRIYFSMRGDTNNVVIGPIKSIGDFSNNQVEVLWITKPKDYKAFDYGSPCPDNCTNNNDLTGYSTP